MSQLNGNDIDDLFRRASDRYPLRTDNADWERVAADLDRDPSLILPPIIEEGGRRKRRHFFWLFLLLPLGGAIYFVARSAGHGSSGQPLIVRQAPQAGPAATLPSASAPSTANPGSPVLTPSSKKSSSPAFGPKTSIPLSINPNSSSVPSGGVTTPGREIAGRGASHGSGKTASTRRTGSAANGNGFGNDRTTFGGDRTTFGDDRTGFGDDRTGFGDNKTGLADGKKGLARQESSFGDDKTGFSGDGKNSFPVHPMGLHRLHPVSTGGGIALDVKVVSPVKPAPAKTTKLAAPQKTTHFYAGLIAAPDLSMVKMQSIKGVGTTYGLLLGYNINRKWAIETGVNLDRKKYYSDGEYFNTKKIYLPNTTKISSVDGVCNMWEIPLNIRYNFGQGEKTKWFATAGFSNYLMTKESYKYQIENTSSGVRYPYSREYPTNSHYLFSIVNLSIGYEQKIGKVGDLRIEPYLRVPLSGIGTGSLPIMSAGLNIGITRRIW